MALQRTPAGSDRWSGDHLVLSHFTLERHHDIADRVRIAKEAGYDGIGLYFGHYAKLKADGEVHRLDEALAEHDMPLTDIEVLRGWGTVGIEDADYAAMEATVWEMADRYGCRYVQAIGDVEGTVAEAGAKFGALCDRAGEHGLVVGFEFLPFTNITDADGGRAIVEAAARSNGGLCVDIWHHTRGSNDLEQIKRLSAEHVIGIQMNDGPLEPTITDDYVQDCLRYRVPPGQGEMNAVDFVTELLRIGVDVPWQLEVCNDSVWNNADPADVLAHAAASAQGMRDVIAEASARLA